ncbi:unnamed protein product [Thlaspi arvense]|uniref:Uncharacterized protein n=1 Tax=Thlaspi arvense TaxID=13288 RepID=A0AAU9RKD8_THLAR|nr:unnamed protein product [Thlaspi arvense]
MEEFRNLSNEYGFSENYISANLDHNLDEGFEGVPLQHNSPDFSFGLAVPDHGIGKTSPSEKVEAQFMEEAYFHNPKLKYINQVLMEDDAEAEAYFIEDSTLRAAEKALYDILNGIHCPSSSEPIHHQDSISLDATISNSPGYCFNGHVSASNFAQTGFTKDFCYSSHVLNPPVHKTFMSKSSLDRTPNNSSDSVDGPMLMKPPTNVPVDSQLSLQLKWGMRENIRISKGKDKFNCDKDGATSNSNDGILPKDGKVEGRSKGASYPKKHINIGDHFDMKNLLMLCMESVASNDHNTTNKLLKQIKQLSSPSGNVSQRLAHCFAKGLEARLAGTGNLIYRSLTTKERSTSDALEVYKLCISAIPFTNASYYYAIQTILEFARQATSLHIIQFSGRRTIHFMPLIQQLSQRPCGPPKLRFTSIDFPEPGFEPTAIVERERRRWVNYCKKFNVPFEYHGMTQKWEAVDPEDLKIHKDEVLVVMCSYLFHYVMDDSFLENSPRDVVLKLIKRINPDVFLHGILNGPLNSPFFVSRFREALFYFSVVFDMFEATMPRKSPTRMMCETEICGKEILNIIASEGLERIERRETYKSWQVRTLRAGFKQLPLNQDIIKKIKAKVKANFHRDFFVDEAAQWMVQGWKGRVLDALSCWDPS